MLNEFREFLARGNVIDLSVAVIMGAAFTAIVNSLVDDIFMPFIGLLLGGIDFSGLVVEFGDAAIYYGNFIQATINFVLIAFVLFMVIRTFNQLRRTREQEAQEAPPEMTAEEKLLMEIRDLLKSQGE